MTSVGYLVNHPAGLAGAQGIGYDYVMAANGLYIQSRNNHLIARITIAPTRIRGLQPVTQKVDLPLGRIPSQLFNRGLDYLTDDPHRERFFGIRHNGDDYQLVIPQQASTPTALLYSRPTNLIAEFHSHGRLPAYFSATDDQDEQGLAIYGVVGKVHRPRPEIALRVGIYGHFGSTDWKTIFEGAPPEADIIAP